MSTEDINGKDDNIVSICANCGKGEEESHKLKHCNACKFVKYCSRDCQIAHRPQHKKECKIRAAELHDIELFKQPPPKEDCPICFLRLPCLDTGSNYYSCCGKVICSGCNHAPRYDHQGNKVDNQKCPFCRTPSPLDEEVADSIKKRVDAGDAIAIYTLGCFYRDGEYDFSRDHRKALELWHRAGELGYADAYTNIGHAYETGTGVEIDMKKATHYYERAAMGGDVNARYNLGVNEAKAGNYDRAVKHYMVAVKDGDSESLKLIKQFYSYWRATKEDYTTALRSYQAYLGDIKSDQRDRAAADDDSCRYYESGI